MSLDMQIRENRIIPTLPGLDALVTSDMVSEILKGKFTYPLCKVIETNREGIMLILSQGIHEKFDAQKYPLKFSEDEMNNFIDSKRIDDLVESAIERERQEKITYWEKLSEEIQVPGFHASNQENGKKRFPLGTTVQNLENICREQLELLGKNN